MTHGRWLRISCVMVTAGVTAYVGTACFCPDSCDQPERIASRTYKSSSNTLSVDKAAGIVVVTRVEGGKTSVEKWRIVGRGETNDVAKLVGDAGSRSDGGS